MPRVFILSPARSDGVRAKLLFNPRADFELAHRLQRGEARPVGEVFSFLSGLYFRGKFAYAQAFNHPRKIGEAASWVITSDRGLLALDAPITLEDLRAFSQVPIEVDEARYQEPLRRDVARLCRDPDCEYVLLGSISTDKYVSTLLEFLGDRLFFPIDFIGRGDMSRGGLLLRSVRNRGELAYTPLVGAIRRGKRPPKLIPLPSERRSRPHSK